MARIPLSRRISHATRPLRDAAAVPLAESVRRVMAALPHGAVLWLGRQMGRLGWLVSGKLRRRALANLELAGIGENPRGRRAIVRRMFESLGMRALEALHATGWGEATLRSRVTFDRPEKVREAIALDKGVIPVTGHFGNWEIMPRAYRLTFDTPVTILMASQRNRKLNDWIMHWRRHQGCDVIATDEGALGMIRVLRRGGTLALLSDQDTTRARGMFVTFFGRPAYTPVGPATMCQRYGAPILPMTIHRRPDDPRRHIVRLGDPLLADPAADPEAEVERLTQAYTAALERQIRETPEDWVWLHDRWRHKPGDRIRVRSAGGKRIPA